MKASKPRNISRQAARQKSDSRKPIAIEKGIPLPAGYRERPTYPWRRMKIGDSFLFPRDKKFETAKSQAFAAARATSRKFIVRRTPKGVRCWRVG